MSNNKEGRLKHLSKSARQKKTTVLVCFFNFIIPAFIQTRTSWIKQLRFLLPYTFCPSILRKLYSSLQTSQPRKVCIFISADCNDILQCTPSCKINTPMRATASRPCALHLNNWQQAVLASKRNSAVPDCLCIHNVNSTGGHWNEEKKQHFTCLFDFFSWSMFFIVWIKWQACVLYINNNHMK